MELWRVTLKPTTRNEMVQFAKHWVQNVENFVQIKAFKTLVNAIDCLTLKPEGKGSCWTVIFIWSALTSSAMTAS
jgi:hypothetical protein